MPEGAVDVRLATEAELEAVTALLVAQLREHHVATPEAKLASAIEAVLRHPERGRILVAIERGRPVGLAALSFVWPLEHGGRSAWLEELYVEPAAGAPFVTWATLPAAASAFTARTPAELRATPRALRQLCAACGTALTFRETARPSSVDVTVRSMDLPDAIVPAAHIWTSSQLAWLRLGDDLPRHTGADPGERDVEP